ncbi:MAG: hypothetical protein ABFC78_08205 [Methanoregula sp.]
MVCIPVAFADTASARTGTSPVHISSDIGTPDVSTAGLPSSPSTEAAGPTTSATTRLATPFVVSPYNGARLYHYPRTTTLAWKPVPSATGYLVERMYSDGTWHAYPTVTVTGNTATWYTFDFIGDQPGAWRITALDSSGTYLTSLPSAWRTFIYSTGVTLATPVATSPVNNTVFYNYPRVTTVTWKPVPGASSYSVEIQFGNPAGTTWSAMSTDSVTTPSDTFTFVGAQPGRWRVKAIGTGMYLNSATNAWVYFSYTI